MTFTQTAKRQGLLQLQKKIEYRNQTNWTKYKNTKYPNENINDIIKENQSCIMKWRIKNKNFSSLSKIPEKAG